MGDVGRFAAGKAVNYGDKLLIYIMPHKTKGRGYRIFVEFLGKNEPTDGRNYITDEEDGVIEYYEPRCICDPPKPSDHTKLLLPDQINRIKATLEEYEWPATDVSDDEESSDSEEERAAAKKARKEEKKTVEGLKKTAEEAEKHAQNACALAQTKVALATQAATEGDAEKSEDTMHDAKEANRRAAESVGKAKVRAIRVKS